MVAIVERIYTRADLDGEEVVGGCGKPVNAIFAQCHPGAPLYLGYEKGRGLLRVACAACRQVVAVIRVAE